MPTNGSPFDLVLTSSVFLLPFLSPSFSPLSLLWPTTWWPCPFREPGAEMHWSRIQFTRATYFRCNQLLRVTVEIGEGRTLTLVQISASRRYLLNNYRARAQELAEDVQRMNKDYWSQTVSAFEAKKQGRGTWVAPTGGLTLRHGEWRKMTVRRRREKKMQWLPLMWEPPVWEKMHTTGVLHSYTSMHFH